MAQDNAACNNERSAPDRNADGEALLLGFQHYLLTLGITVLIPTILVPQMGGGDAEKARVIQTLLLASGISTFLQSLLGTRLPIVVVANRYKSYTDPYERFTQTMRGIQGALITTSCFQMAVGFFGLWRNAVRFLRPLCVVPYVTFTGLSLYRLGFPMLAKCVEVGLPALNIFYLNRYMSTKKPIYDRYSVLFTISSAWLFALVLTSCTAYNHKPQSTQNSCRTDRAGLISAAPWVYFPRFFQWGSPTFNAGEAFAMMTASFVSLFEVGITLYPLIESNVNNMEVPPSVISRGAGWMVVSTLLSGKENAGLLALTKAGSRRVNYSRTIVGCLILFIISESWYHRNSHLMGKFGSFFASVPMPIMATLYCVLFGYVSSAGLGYLQFCNLNNFRNKSVLCISFFLGLSIPQYFTEYYHLKQHYEVLRWFNDVVTVIFMSHTTVAALVAFILDAHCPWWERFGLYSSYVKNDEFYSLPCKLDKLFPPV
ncbi:hypothetical protein AAZV13_17G203900 [Glycine max]